jgi:hypothetical protein
VLHSPIVLLVAVFAFVHGGLLSNVIVVVESIIIIASSPFDCWGELD